MTEMTRTEQQTMQKTTPLSWASPPVDVLEGQDEYLVFADVPGVEKDGISIQYAEGELKLSATRSGAPEGWPSEYRRVFAVGPDVDVERIEAKLEHGVLAVHLPKTVSAKPRQIEIKTA